MNNGKDVVCVVDDDCSVCRALTMLIETLDVEVRPYSSAREFLASGPAQDCDCLVLDVRMPGVDGLELQSRLAAVGWRAPIIFVTGHGEVPMAVRALQAGAVDFLQKPLDDAVLLDRVQAALESSRERNAREERHAALASRLDLLSAREREVLQLLMAGKMNKVIAHELSLSVKTIEDHRASVMAKSGAKSLAELVQMVLQAQQGGWRI